MQAAQVKTKRRVSDHGEVLTGHREVNAMLDLVKQETERIDSRFLEPACGDGNFLSAILERKLAVVEKRYGKSQLDFERNAVLAVSQDGNAAVTLLTGMPSGTVHVVLDVNGYFQ